MTDPFWGLIAVFAFLQIKHFVCDYPLQTLYQLQNKGTWGHPGGLVHAGIHAVLTLPVFLVVTPSLWLGAAIVAGEFVVHYHVDWAKQQVNERYRLQASQREFWWSIGADQLVHQLTYVVLAGVLVGVTLGTG